MDNGDKSSDHPLLGNMREQFGDEVKQAIIFQRAGADTARYVTSHSSPLAGLLMRFAGKKRAGGLPNMGILTITSDMIRAYSTKGGGMRMRAKEEAAQWERAAIRASMEKKGGAQRMTLESPVEGEKVTIEVMRGYEPMAEEIVGLIQGQ